MTVKELIKELKSLDQNLEVYFAHPSHDYWKSELATEVSEADVESIKFSAYHDQMVTADDEKSAARGEETQSVLILR